MTKGTGNLQQSAVEVKIVGFFGGRTPGNHFICFTFMGDVVAEGVISGI